jgi:hypothetical protein
MNETIFLASWRINRFNGEVHKRFFGLPSPTIFSLSKDEIDLN